MDVFYHHDSIVHEDAYREDEGKKGDPVQGIAVGIGDEDRKGKGDRHGNGNDDRFTPSEGDGDEEGDRGCREKHMLEELVRFIPAVSP